MPAACLRRNDLMHDSRRGEHSLPRLEPALLELRFGPPAERELPHEDVHRLILLVMILQTQHVAGFHVQHLPDVSVGPGPDELVPPRLLDLVRDVRHHCSTTWSLKEEGEVMQARTQTPHPTHPSALITGWPSTSIANAVAPTGHDSAQALQVTPEKVTQRSGTSSSAWSLYPFQISGGRVSAPVGQAAAQGISAQATQGCSSTSRYGVPAANPSLDGAVRIARGGQTSTQALQRGHPPRNGP